MATGNISAGMIGEISTLDRIISTRNYFEPRCNEVLTCVATIWRARKEPQNYTGQDQNDPALGAPGKFGYESATSITGRTLLISQACCGIGDGKHEATFRSSQSLFNLHLGSNQSFFNDEGFRVWKWSFLLIILWKVKFKGEFFFMSLH